MELDTFGPSTPGAINVVSGNTYGTICGPASSNINAPVCTAAPGSAPTTPGTPAAQGPGTNYSDSDPNYDKCSATQDGNTAAGTIQMGGTNIGDLLDQAKAHLGLVPGRLRVPGLHAGSVRLEQGEPSDCTGTHTNNRRATVTDYSPHHEPFEYYASTANPQHLPPTSVSMIGHQDQANHQYDLADFLAAADHDNLPAVSYLKAAEYQDGHAGYSDPLDEQTCLADTINHLEQLPTWKSTAVVVLYDDSRRLVRPPAGADPDPVASVDRRPSAPGQCGANPAEGRHRPRARSSRDATASAAQPLLVISPFASGTSWTATRPRTSPRS